MKYLITGGCGFLGSNLAENVLKRSEELFVFDNLSRQGATQNLEWLQSKGKFTWIHGDIRNQNEVDTAVAKINPDRIFHLAGQVAMTTSIQNPRLDFETNVLGTINVLEAARKYVPEAGILFSSTNKVYGDLEEYTYVEDRLRYACAEAPRGFNEQTRLDFRSPYGCSKGAADQYILDSKRIYGTKTVVFRHSSIFGRRQFSTFDQGWIGWFIQQALETKKNPQHSFTVSGNGKQVRDVLFSEDIVNCYFSASEKLDLIAGEAFNIGGGFENSFSLLELFALLESNLNVKLNFKMIDWRQSDQRVFISDNTKATKHFGWSPKISSKQGVQEMVQWLQNQK